MEKAKEENGTKDSTDRKLDWVVKNPLWAVVILIGWGYYNKDKQVDVLNQKFLDRTDKMLEYQDKLIDGFGRLEAQTENAEKRSRMKKDTVYVH